MNKCCLLKSFDLPPSKFEPLGSFQFSSLKMIVKNRCDLFQKSVQKYVRVLHGWAILSQDSRIQSRLQ